MTVLDLRESALRRDRITRSRLDSLIPSLMIDCDVDSWVLVSREYAEDPVVQTMIPAKWMSSRRRTILVFLRVGESVTRASVSRYELEGLFPRGWDPESQPDQWQALRELIASANPERIAVSTSEHFAHADGLTASERDLLLDALGPDLAARVVPGDQLAVLWLQTRLPEEREVLQIACARAHEILRRSLSREAIDPGSTTTEDVEWWLRDQVQRLGCEVWFHPAVSVQRAGADLRGPLSSTTRAVTIEPGDLVHIDFGIVWDHLCTDQQQHGYVLRAGEPDVPTGLQQALARGNDVQDVLLSCFEEGKSGNDILASALQRCRDQRLDAVIYTHPIGYHGHGAGPAIGLWDQQSGVSGSGDLAIFGPSAWSIELMSRSAVREWDGQEVAIMLEEEAWYEAELVSWVDGRQTSIWAI